MDVTLSYAAWLSQQQTDDNTLTVTFEDASSVFFSNLDHETHLVSNVAEVEELNVD